MQKGRTDPTYAAWKLICLQAGQWVQSQTFKVAPWSLFKPD